MRCFLCLRVALRKESVDRNRDQLDVAMSGAVALRKESVDRNRGGNTHANRYYVALRKESVDRNTVTLLSPSYPLCRSPQGERG